MEYKSFETERLYIRPCVESDAAFILELLNTPKWIENIGDRKVYNIEDAKKYIANKITPGFKKLGYSAYSVVLKEDNVIIGNCGLYDREGLDGVDIGFAFLPAYENKGYAYESAQRLMVAAQEDFNLKEVNAITTKENKASQKLLEKLGLTYRRIVNIPNDPIDLLFYSISL